MAAFRRIHGRGPSEEILLHLPRRGWQNAERKVGPVNPILRERVRGRLRLALLLLGAALSTACSSGRDETLEASRWLEESRLASWKPLLLPVGPDEEIEIRLTAPLEESRLSVSGDEIRMTHLAPGRWRLHGLRPGRRYEYRLTGPGRATGCFDFVTADELGRPVRVAALGDSRDGAGVHVSLMKRFMSWKPSLVLHTGDLLGDGSSRARWEEAIDWIAPVTAAVPYVLARGNHEKSHALWAERFSPDGASEHWSFLHGCLRILVLSTEQAADGTQKAFLESLKKDADRWTLVVFHQGFFNMGHHSSAEKHRALWMPLFDSIGVDLVLSGHEHGYGRRKDGKMTLVVTGGGGAPPYRDLRNTGGWSTVAAKHHVLLLEAIPAKLQGTAVAADGSIIDRFTLTR